MAQVGVFHAGEGETLSDPGSFMVTADGKDRVGVVAALATALADLGVAIDSIDQTIDGDKFHIEISAHVATSNSSFEAISNTLDQVGIDNGFTVRTFSVDSDEV
ncbi:MAG: ACT domain-containing protein [Coriobacteriales bacterium]